MFKHALIRDVAYQSLLKSTRQQYHRRIAQVLAEQFPALVDTQPELLAHHYTEAGAAQEAIVYWQRAGQRAIRQSSNLEALDHLRKGLELLHLVPDTAERTRHELMLQLSLGAALIATKGYAAPEVALAYTRARALCQEIGEVPRLLQVLLGLEAYYVVRAELHTAYDMAQQCVVLAQQIQNPARLLNSHHALGLSLFHLGEPAAALTHLEQGMLLYDAQPHHPHHNLQNPGVACRSYAAWALWHLGYAEQAQTRLQEALTMARGLSHPYSMAYVLCFAAGLHQYLRHAPEAQAAAEEAIAISSEHGFPFWFAMGTCLYGWALAKQGQAEAGVVRIRHGIAAWRATGAELAQPHWLALLADGCGQLGQVEEGLEVLEQAFGFMEKYAERYYEAELYRLKGALLLQHSPPLERLAERCFHQAMDRSSRQQAKLPQLRAGISLSRLWRQQGKHAAAHQQLAELYGWFTEGWHTADLQEAKALLEELA
jgi:predicted ATPase